MEKIIAAFDGLKYSGSTRDYAIYLAQQTNAHLVGVFMDDEFYTSYKLFELATQTQLTENKLRKLQADDKATRKTAAANFEKACQNGKLEYSIHHDRKIAIKELSHESIYSDLLVIDNRETLNHYSEKSPTRFIRDLLNDAACPLLLVPKEYTPIRHIKLLYNGEPSSVHAIKLFSYLLPQLKNLDIELISVNPPGATLHIHDNKLMKEFMKSHFSKTKFTALKGFAHTEIVKYLSKQQENTVVVLGSDRRGPFSRWFRDSMADILLKELQLPLFIAYNAG